MFEKIKELIVESLGIEEDQVTMEASFKEDLKVDSLDLFEMVMSLEDEFDVEIPTEELEKMETVGDVVEYIKEHKQAEGQRMKTVITVQDLERAVIHMVHQIQQIKINMFGS